MSCWRGRGALLSGRIGTFDDLFEEIARAGGSSLPVATDAQRQLIVRTAVAQTSLNGLGASARFSGFSDALGAALAELESGLVEPDQLSGDLALLYSSYRAELEKLGLWDRDLRRRHAADLVSGELDAWSDRPVFAYGFEDLTGAQWALLEALAGRTDVTVSLPYEPNRAPFESLTRTSEDLSSLAAGRIEELPPGYAEIAPPELAHLERHLFADRPPAAPELQGAIRFLEGAGARGTLELVADEVLQLIRAGTKPEEILLVCPSVERQRAQLETALSALEVPYAIEGRMRIGKTAFGQALLSFLRFEWLAGGRHDLYGFLRSPFSGLTRAHVDYLEGRLRGRGVSDPTRVVEETLKLRGQPLRMLDAFRDEPDSLEAVRALVRSMVRSAYGLDAPPVGPGADPRLARSSRPSTTCWTNFAPGSTSAARSPVKSSTARSTGPRFGSPVATSPAASRSPTSSARERVEPRSSSCSVWRRGASPAASRARPSSPTRSAGRSTRHPAARG